MHWSQTESSKWSCNRVSTRPGPPPYGLSLLIISELVSTPPISSMAINVDFFLVYANCACDTCPSPAWVATTPRHAPTAPATTYPSHVHPRTPQTRHLAGACAASGRAPLARTRLAPSLAQAQEEPPHSLVSVASRAHNISQHLAGELLLGLLALRLESHAREGLLEVRVRVRVKSCARRPG